jgi:hypothetical protein
MNAAAFSSSKEHLTVSPDGPKLRDGTQPHPLEAAFEGFHVWSKILRDIRREPGRLVFHQIARHVGPCLVFSLWSIDGPELPGRDIAHVCVRFPAAAVTATTSKGSNQAATHEQEDARR